MKNGVENTVFHYEKNNGYYEGKLPIKLEWQMKRLNMWSLNWRCSSPFQIAIKGITKGINVKNNDKYNVENYPSNFNGAFSIRFQW